MKTNSKKDLFVLICVVLLIVLIDYGYTSLYQQNDLKLQKDEQFKPVFSSTKYLFLGDSHVLYDLNESPLNNSFNYGISGESYVQQYVRLAEILSSNNSLEYVFLQIDPHIFEAYNPSESISADITYYKNRLSTGDLKYILGDEYSFFQVRVLSYFRSLDKHQKIVNFLFQKLFGLANEKNVNGDFSLNENKNRDARLKVQQQFAKDYRFNPISFYYFNQTLHLLSSQNISVYFIRYPLSTEYRYELDQQEIELEEYYQTIFSTINQSNISLTLFDYAELINDSSLFFDENHLNLRGRAILSAQVKNDFCNSVEEVDCN